MFGPSQSRPQSLSQGQAVYQTAGEGMAMLLKRNVFGWDRASSSLQYLIKHMKHSISINKKDEFNSSLERPNVVTTVEVKCTFLKIGDVDTLYQNFDAEVLIQAKWEEPALDFTEKNKEQFDAFLFWGPKIFIANVIGDFDINLKTYIVRLHEDGYSHAVVLMLWRVKGKFRENLELEHFPFDVQDLTIQISSERSVEEIEMIDDKHAMSTVNIRMFQDAQEWSIYEHVEIDHKITTRKYATYTIHPMMHVQIRVKRKIGFFVWNIMVIVCLILALSFGGLAIDPNNPDRMGLTITLFLTSVAFKLVMKSLLPGISYLTYLDVYLFGTLFFLAMYSSASAILCTMSKWLPLSELIVWDNYIMCSLAAILLAFHLLLASHIYFTAYRKRRKMERKDNDYIKRRDYLARHGVLLTLGYSSLMIDDY